MKEVHEIELRAKMKDQSSLSKLYVVCFSFADVIYIQIQK